MEPDFFKNGITKVFVVIAPFMVMIAGAYLLFSQGTWVAPFASVAGRELPGRSREDGQSGRGSSVSSKSQSGEPDRNTAKSAGAGGSGDLSAVSGGAGQELLRVVPRGGPVLPLSGLRVEARVQTGNELVDVVPNSLGNFPRVGIEPGALVQVKMVLPFAEPGDPVVVEVQDGGHLDDKKMAKVTTLGPAKMVEFNFQATTNPGINHIVVRTGAQVRVLQLWVGPEQELAGS